MFWVGVVLRKDCELAGVLPKRWCRCSRSGYGFSQKIDACHWLERDMGIFAAAVPMYVQCNPLWLATGVGGGDS